MRALFVFSPTESKRLIAKAVANMEEVKKAKERDRIVIAHGSTTVVVVEEIMGEEKLVKLMDRNAYVTGIVKQGVLCSALGGKKHPLLVLNRGIVEPPADTMREIFENFGPESVFIKGANAVDPEGNAGVFVAHPEGGTIGWAIAGPFREASYLSMRSNEA
jgi:DeoR/GlpR family transcriptional regulator of sugar metabolism